MWAGAGWRPMITLGMSLGLVIGQGVVLLLAPQMAASLGESTSSVSGAWSGWLVGLLLATPFALRLGLGAPRRVPMVTSGTLLLAVGLCGAAMSTSVLTIAIASFAAGAGTVLVASAALPLLADLYPPSARLRVVAAAATAASIGVALVGALTILLPQAEPLTWRAGMLLAAIDAAVVGLAVAWIAEPATGALESERVTYLFGNLNGATSRLADAAPPRMRFPEAVRRTHSLASVQPLMMAAVALGACIYGAGVYGSFLLGEAGAASLATIGLVEAGCALAAGVVLVLVGPAAEAAYAKSPVELAMPARWTAVGVVAAAAVLVVSTARRGVLVEGLGLAAFSAGLAVAVLLAAHLLLSVLAPELRPVGAILAVVYAAGGIAGAALLLPPIDEAGGLGWAFAAAGLAAVSASLLVARAAARAEHDFEGAVEAMVESREVAVAAALGTSAPLLSCRRVCFSYGQLQVLFDVDFAVEEGEMVALLGTNGAGKSTLLKVVSGIGIPSSGAVRHRGRDITFMDPGERVRRGITQIPGGKAVFGPLSVADNLRLYGYSLGRDRKTIDRGIEEGFAAFPRLAERRNALASTMSGGEQQMLALTKAMILKPGLLLIDELSLGLAPKVVGELLELVRKINQAGTAVVLVEQSVNVALSLASRAYFMEKGAVQFDGPTADLLERPDVLRSVFLRGAAAGLAG